MRRLSKTLWRTSTNDDDAAIFKSTKVNVKVQFDFDDQAEVY